MDKNVIKDIDSLNTKKETLSKEDRKKRSEAKLIVDEAFRLIKEGKNEEANIKLDEAYSLDNNYGEIFIAKLYIKYNIKNFNDFRAKANDEIIQSSFFKAGFDLGDNKLRERLNKIIEEVEYKKLELNLEEADIEQLLKHLRIQKNKGIDYIYTLSLILSILYKSFRFLNKDYIDLNMNRPNFIAVIKKCESSFEQYMDILYHYDDILDIKDTISKCIKENKSNKVYLLLILNRLIENTIDKDKLIEIKDYLEYSYVNHEADELIELINPKLKQDSSLNKKGIITALVSISMSVVFIIIGIGVAQNTQDAPLVRNGITYIKNELNGYTIASYDESETSVNLLDTIDGYPVNKINNNVFSNTNINYIYNFPSSIVSIPNDCFLNCSSLILVEINEDSLLSTIEENAFKNCESLNTLYIPETILNIGDNAFLNTPNLVNLTKASQVNFNEERIGLTKRSIAIEFSETSNNPTYFYSWDKINLYPLSDYDLYDFSGYNINNDVSDFISYDKDDNTSMSLDCKGYYNLLLTPVFYTTKTYIDTYDGYQITYTRRSNNTEYEISSVTKISDSILDYVSLSHYINGCYVTKLNENAFKNNRDIRSILNLSKYIDEIPDNAFSNCVKLETISFSIYGDNLTRIGVNAFNNCSSLYSLRLPSTITEIGDNAFLGTDRLYDLSTNYDFLKNDTSLKIEARRIGLTERNYTVSLDGNIIDEGTYFNIEGNMDIEIPIKEGYRIVLLDESNNLSLVGDSQDDNVFNINLNKTLRINIVIKYEKIYDSTYNLEVSLNNDSSYLDVSNNEGVISLSSSLFDSNNNLIEIEEEVSYEVSNASNNLIYNFTSNDSIIVSKNDNSVTRPYMEIRAIIKGRYSEKTLLTSESKIIIINFL